MPHVVRCPHCASPFEFPDAPVCICPGCGQAVSAAPLMPTMPPPLVASALPQRFSKPRRGRSPWLVGLGICCVLWLPACAARAFWRYYAALSSARAVMNGYMVFWGYTVKVEDVIASSVEQGLLFGTTLCGFGALTCLAGWLFSRRSA